MDEPRAEKPEDAEPGESDWVEQWTGAYVFENEWQSFRARKDRQIELVSVAKETTLPIKVAVKVVDIFGNDTMQVLEVRK